jgi:hypothetical protein
MPRSNPRMEMLESRNVSRRWTRIAREVVPARTRRAAPPQTQGRPPRKLALHPRLDRPSRGSAVAAPDAPPGAETAETERAPTPKKKKTKSTREED